MENSINSGVYYIKNIVTNDIYIGSTTRNFNKRKKEHFYELIKNKHKNHYLQNSFNKYGIENFVFEILEICNPEQCFEKEQHYIDSMMPSFNINLLASGTPNMSKETIIKRTKTFVETSKKCLEEYYAVKNKTLDLNDVSCKCKKIVNGKLNTVIWSKGLTKKDFDTSHLRVPKRNMLNWKNRVEKSIATVIAKQKPFYVFNHLGEQIGYFINTLEFINFSETNEVLRYTNKEKVKTFKSFNIQNCLRNKSKHYKGLIFSYNEKVNPLEPKDLHFKYTSFKQANFAAS